MSQATCEQQKLHLQEKMSGLKHFSDQDAWKLKKRSMSDELFDATNQIDPIDECKCTFNENWNLIISEIFVFSTARD